MDAEMVKAKSNKIKKTRKKFILIEIGKKCSNSIQLNCCLVIKYKRFFLLFSLLSQ
jgi:hypothetical protein